MTSWGHVTRFYIGIGEAAERMRSAGIRAALLAALVVGSAGKIVNKARTQELFHTPYREEDSRHFKVLPSALVWASLCYSLRCPCASSQRQRNYVAWRLCRLDSCSGCAV